VLPNDGFIATAPARPPGRHRARWAAVGTAVAVTLGAGGLSIVGAAGTDDLSAFVPVDACRRFDTRPESQIGEFDTPFGPGEIRGFQITGEHGDCASIPADALGVVINLTTVNGTAPSNMRAFAADLAVPPIVSNSNWVDCEARPNLATVQLSDSGAIAVMNAFGDVDAIGDIAGYYLSLDGLVGEVHHLADQLEALHIAQPFAVANSKPETLVLNGGLNGNYKETVAVSFTPLVDGHVTVNSSLVVRNLDGVAEVVSCSITDGIVYDNNADQSWERNKFDTALSGGTINSLSGTRGFDVSAGEVAAFGLFCKLAAGHIAIVSDRHLTAVFTPAPVQP